MRRPHPRWRPLLLLSVLPALSLAEARQESGKHFLWKVSDASGHAVHLFGSIHMATPEVYPLPQTVEAAFEQATHLAVEADIEEVDAARLMRLSLSLARLPEGQTLSTLLSEPTRALLDEWLPRYGLSLKQMDAFQPWYLALNLAGLSVRQAGLDPEHGIDRHFLRRRGDRTVEELEGMEKQLGLFAGFGFEQQEQLLVWTLADLDQIQRETQRLLATWKAGDVEGLRRIVEAGVRDRPETKPVVDALLGQRNEGMREKVEAMLKKKQKAFVVVGAAHLVGDQGLPALLQKKGYTVEQL